MFKVNGKCYRVNCSKNRKLTVSPFGTRANAVAFPNSSLFSTATDGFFEGLFKNWDDMARQKTTIGKNTPAANTTSLKNDLI